MAIDNPELLERLNRARQKKEPKKPQPIAKQSEKKKAQLAEEKGDREEKEAWFKAVRKLMTGTCQCGCGQPSQKNSDEHFRGSACHVFPKNDFLSVRFHLANFVERAMFGGCHHNMDHGGMDKWPNMADWEDLKRRFYILEPLLTPEEKTKKFYHRLKELVETN